MRQKEIDDLIKVSFMVCDIGNDLSGTDFNHVWAKVYEHPDGRYFVAGHAGPEFGWFNTVDELGGVSGGSGLVWFTWDELFQYFWNRLDDVGEGDWHARRAEWKAAQQVVHAP